uniref:Uncharacterized protein n=1 Tax=Noccaea caerulescens TaxID=107243 RepID=A0A1J3D780_NOCCA
MICNTQIYHDANAIACLLMELCLVFPSFSCCRRNRSSHVHATFFHHAAKRPLLHTYMRKKSPLRGLKDYF